MCFELDGVRLLQLQDSERRNNMSAEGGSLPAMWGCVRTIGAVSPRSRRLSLMDLNRGTSGTTLTLHWGGLGVKACGADCTRDRLCTDASGLGEYSRVPLILWVALSQIFQTAWVGAKRGSKKILSAPLRLVLSLNLRALAPSCPVM
jgi:hypothetical protein